MSQTTVAGLKIATRMAQAQRSMLKRSNSNWSWETALGVLITSLKRRIEQEKRRTR
jgi:hypothetical protein